MAALTADTVATAVGEARAAAEVEDLAALTVEEVEDLAVLMVEVAPAEVAGAALTVEAVARAEEVPVQAGVVEVAIARSRRVNQQQLLISRTTRKP
jgi:hypothetical protein